MRKTRREAHPLLRGGRREGSYSHGFSSSEIQSLSSICGTFIPSAPMESTYIAGKGDPASKTLESYYLASGSQHPIPDEVAEFLRKRAIPEDVSLIRWVLWIVATRLGTLILCGFSSFSWKYPFIYKFSEIPAEKRGDSEELVKGKVSNCFEVGLCAA